MFKLIVGLNVIIGLIALGIIGTMGYLVYFLVTQPEAVNQWFQTLIG